MVWGVVMLLFEKRVFFYAVKLVRRLLDCVELVKMKAFAMLGIPGIDNIGNLELPESWLGKMSSLLLFAVPFY